MAARPPEAHGPGDAEREIQEALVVGEQLQQELRAFDEQRGLLDSMVRDLRRGREALEALAKAGPGEEVLLPVGGGTFLRATIADKDRVIASLGAGILIESPLPAAIARLEERAKGAEEALEKTSMQVRQIEQELVRLNQHLQRMGMR